MEGCLGLDKHLLPELKLFDLVIVSGHPVMQVLVSLRERMGFVVRSGSYI
jgi:hypothetical protein